MWNIIWWFLVMLVFNLRNKTKLVLKSWMLILLLWKDKLSLAGMQSLIPSTTYHFSCFFSDCQCIYHCLNIYKLWHSSWQTSIWRGWYRWKLVQKSMKMKVSGVEKERTLTNVAMIKVYDPLVPMLHIGKITFLS